MSILIDKLKDFNYYVSKIPMYLQNSEGFLEHFKIWYDFLIGKENSGCVGTSDTLLDLINIFDPEYDEKYISGEINLASNLLEKLGSIFNISHNFSVMVNGNSQQLNLTDSEFLILLKAQIIKNYSEGSYEQYKELYDKLGWFITYSNANFADVTVNYVVIPGVEPLVELTPNLEACWKTGLLGIEAMGINYRYYIMQYNVSGTWDSSLWDEGVWI